MFLNLFSFAALVIVLPYVRHHRVMWKLQLLWSIAVLLLLAVELQTARETAARTVVTCQLIELMFMFSLLFKLLLKSYAAQVRVDRVGVYVCVCVCVPVCAS